MNRIAQSALLLFSVSVIVISCKKDHSPAPTPPAPPSVGKMHIDLTYLRGVKDSLKSYEMIISESSGGKVLLDTIVAPNIPVVLDLLTSQSLVDLTVIHSYITRTSSSILVYKAVNLATWAKIPASDSIPGSTITPIVQTGLDTINYINAPIAAFVSPYQFCLSGGGSSGIWYNSRQTISFSNAEHDAYLVFPNSALYNLHHIIRSNDTVDLIKMDTAMKIKFLAHHNYGLRVDLYGYMDSTDLSREIALTASTGNLQTNPDTPVNLVYPGKKVIQKYDLYITGYAIAGTSPADIASTTLYKTDTIPTDIGLPDLSWYTIGSHQNNNFSVSFTKQKPSFYTVNGQFTNGSTLSIISPSDSATLYPVNFLGSLKTKLLSGQDLTTLSLTGFSFTIAADPTYQSYMTRTSSLSAPAGAASNIPINSRRTYSRSL